MAEGPRLGRCALAAAFAVALAACTPDMVLRGASTPAFAVPRDAFAIAGRLSARHAGEGLSTHFRWEHDKGRDTLQLSSPLGETIARMSGEEGRVELERADGSRQSAASWDELTSRGLGWKLPVSGLAWWIQGVPDPRSPFTWEGTSNPRVLRQEGWTIVYTGASTAAGMTRPIRLTLSYPEIEVRIAVDAWQ